MASSTSARFGLCLTTALVLALASPTTILATDTFVDAVERGHAADAWRAHQAFQADLTVTFGGNTMLEGTMTTDIDMRGVRIDLADGTELVWDGQNAWTAPEDAAFAGGRFHLLTWPYFLAAPYKLRDPGSHLESLGDAPFRGDETLPAVRLRFDQGVGDSPDDWYVVYRDPKENRIRAMAYIVTFGTELDAAEADPHAIVYGDVQRVGGVPVPMSWTFFDWSAEGGVGSNQLGRVELRNARFVTPSSETFAQPANARAEQVPGS